MVTSSNKFDAGLALATLSILIVLIGLVLYYDVEILFPRG
jgi:hypothetical protein